MNIEAVEHQNSNPSAKINAFKWNENQFKQRNSIKIPRQMFVSKLSRWLLLIRQDHRINILSTPQYTHKDDKWQKYHSRHSHEGENSILFKIPSNTSKRKHKFHSSEKEVFGSAKRELKVNRNFPSTHPHKDASNINTIFMGLYQRIPINLKQFLTTKYDLSWMYILGGSMVNRHVVRSYIPFFSVKNMISNGWKMWCLLVWIFHFVYVSLLFLCFVLKYIEMTKSAIHKFRSPFHV